jgi:hypothetical protein
VFLRGFPWCSQAPTESATVVYARTHDKRPQDFLRERLVAHFNSQPEASFIPADGGFLPNTVDFGIAAFFIQGIYEGSQVRSESTRSSRPKSSPKNARVVRCAFC